MKNISGLIRKKINDFTNDKTLSLPSFMLVLTRTKCTYKEKDDEFSNIYVVPLGCLKLC